MQFRDITPHQFGLILAQLSDVEHLEGEIHTVSGHHRDLGMTVLARDGTQCMALVDDPRRLDELTTERRMEEVGLDTLPVFRGKRGLGSRLKR